MLSKRTFQKIFRKKIDIFTSKKNRLKLAFFLKLKKVVGVINIGGERLIKLIELP